MELKTWTPPLVHAVMDIVALLFGYSDWSAAKHLSESAFLRKFRDFDKEKKQRINPCENPNSRGELQYTQTAPKTEPPIKSESAEKKKTSFRTSIWSLKNVQTFVF